MSVNLLGYAAKRAKDILTLFALSETRVARGFGAEGAGEGVEAARTDDAVRLCVLSLKPFDAVRQRWAAKRTVAARLHEDVHCVFYREWTRGRKSTSALSTDAKRRLLS